MCVLFPFWPKHVCPLSTSGQWAPPLLPRPLHYLAILLFLSLFCFPSMNNYTIFGWISWVVLAARKSQLKFSATGKGREHASGLILLLVVTNFYNTWDSMFRYKVISKGGDYFGTVLWFGNISIMISVRISRNIMERYKYCKNHVSSHINDCLLIVFQFSHYYTMIFFN